MEFCPSMATSDTKNRADDPQSGAGDKQSRATLWALWALCGGLLLAGGAFAMALSDRFGYQARVVDMPLPELLLALLVVSAPFVLLPFLVPRTLAALKRGNGARSEIPVAKILFAAVLAVGALARVMMLFTTPLMEDDYQRYLWDGALTAHGYNPYKTAPKEFYEMGSRDPVLAELAEQSGKVLERVNHAYLRTIYPPVAQLGFALAYKIKPFSLTAWRLVALVCELVSLALLLILLHRLGKSPLWVALYWWNPLVIKELVNSGHMEVLLVPLLLGALLTALHHAPKLTAFLLALAVGVKVWPALLLPLYLRPFLATPKKLVAPLLIFTSLLALMAWPVLSAGLDHSSGFVAYAEKWKTNSALFPLLEFVIGHLMGLLDPADPPALPVSRAVRGLIAVALALIALGTAWRQPADGPDLAAKTLLITAAMFLLSPAQLPWYAVWFLPFLAFAPLYGLALLVPFLQVYYISFYFYSRDMAALYRDGIIWLVWLPVWTLLAFEVWRLWRPSQLRAKKRKSAADGAGGEGS